MFVLTPGMSIEVEFDYDAPPVDGGRTVDLLEDDQPAYPRDAAHLPAWHASSKASQGRRAVLVVSRQFERFTVIGWWMRRGDCQMIEDQQESNRRSHTCG
jgi:hypothetical protein